MTLDHSASFPRSEITCRVRRHSDWFLQADCVNRWRRGRKSSATRYHRECQPEQWSAVENDDA